MAVLAQREVKASSAKMKWSDTVLYTVVQATSVRSVQIGNIGTQDPTIYKGERTREMASLVALTVRPDTCVFTTRTKTATTTPFAKCSHSVAKATPTIRHEGEGLAQTDRLLLNEHDPIDDR